MRLVVFAMYCDTPTMEWDYLKCYNFIYTTMQQWKNLHSFQLLAVLTLRRKQRKNMFLFSLFFGFFLRITAFRSAWNSQIWTKAKMLAHKHALENVK